MKEQVKQFRLRSFVRRGGLGTKAQARAHAAHWPSFGLEMKQGLLAVVPPCVLEIGFGTGQSLLAIAKQRPEINFIGVETHKAGIGALFAGMQAEAVTNIRVYDADVIDVLEQCLPNESLEAVLIFFPDPWPKRRHIERRLVQPAFIKTIVSKLKMGGELHLATDWEDYAQHMLQVLSEEPSLHNLFGKHSFATRSAYRPLVTKFEQKALRAGRNIRELQFQKV